MFILVIGIILKRFLFEELCRYLLLQLCVCHSFLSFGKVETLTVNKEKWKFLGNFSCFCSACTGSVQVAVLLERLQVVGWWCRWWGRQNWHSWEAISLVPTTSNLTHLSFGVSLLHFWIMMKWVLVCCKWESFFGSFDEDTLCCWYYVYAAKYCYGMAVMALGCFSHSKTFFSSCTFWWRKR